MAFIKDRINEHQNKADTLPIKSAVTSDEKQLLYTAFKRHKKKNLVNNRTARLILIAAAFGFLAAVFAIRLFPM
ncbi:MAG: hypothetical protein AB1Z18_02470 [Desulfobacterales bacterium]